MKIPFSRIDCSGNELSYVSEVLESGWLTTASKAARLEEKMAELTGTRHACAVNSCTAALHLALEALGIGPGDKVLVPTWTFTATAEVVRYLGADPVLLDVDSGTFSLTPETVEQALAENSHVKAVIVVHFGGQAAPVLDGTSEGIRRICERHGVWLVEDAAHALPASEKGIPVGAMGHVACFSFYANKTMTTGEGGMLVTNDPDVARRARIMRLHGIDRDVWARFSGVGGKWEYDVVAPGFKYNMPDINAAVGLAQLERLETMRSERQRCAEYYLEHLADLDCIELPVVRVRPDEHAWHLFPVVLKRNAPIERNRLIELLAADGIGTSIHYKPLHRMTYYSERYALDPSRFPNAEALWNGCLSLPIYSLLSNQELEYIVARLRSHLGC